MKRTTGLLAAALAAAVMLAGCSPASKVPTTLVSSTLASSKSAQTAPIPTVAPSPVVATTSPTPAPTSTVAKAKGLVAGRDLDPCRALAMGVLANAGLRVTPSTATVVRRTDSKEAATALAPIDLDALYTCGAGTDVTATIFDHPNSAAARAAVERDSSSAADIATGSRTRLSQRYATFGYMVDVPGTQTASVKWQHGDLQVDVLIEYTDQNLTQPAVLKLLRDVVTFTDPRLGAR